MRSSFSLPSYGSGVSAEVEQPKPNTEDRSWGELATDVAIDVVGRPVVGALRTGAQAWRMAEDQPRGLAVDVEQGLGAAENWLTEQRSDRARALDTLSVDPRGNERSFWREPIAGAIHTALPSVGYGAAAIATGGSSLLAQIGTAAAMGAVGAGESINELRDFADRTPVAELKKLPIWDGLMREFSGDEAAARHKLFKDIIDPKSQIFNFFVNAANFPALKHGLRAPGVGKAVGERLKAAGYGAAEGVALGAAETGTEEYAQQLAKVRTGEQQAIDTGDISGAIMRGSVFGAPMAAWHAAAPPHRRATPLGTDVGATAEDQLAPPGGPPAPPEAPPRAGGVPPPVPSGPPEGGTQVPPGGPAPRPAPVEEPPPAPAQAAPEPNVDDAVASFKTSMGSEYFAFDDGTTVRNKAARPEHPGDEGWKERSQRTVFLSPEHALEVGGLFQAQSRFGKRVFITPTGMVGIQYTDGPSAGKVERRTYGRALTTPQVGAIPVEIWQDGGAAHFGNPITEVTSRERPQYGPPTEPYGPPTEPEGPQPQPPPPMRPGLAMWTGPSPTTHRAVQVRVLERPPVLDGGRWLQPVAYTNPSTGEAREMNVPINELRPQQGPPSAMRPPEPPPVQTPEQPLAPEFPEIEQPGRPMPSDFGVEPEPVDLGTVEEEPTGTLAANPVLRDLQRRFAQRQTEERDVERSAERARQRRVNAELRERMPEMDWRDVRGPEERPAPPRRPSPLMRVVGEMIRREQQPLRTVSERLRADVQERAARREQDRRTEAFQERARNRREREETAAAERRQATQRDLDAEAEARADRERRGRELERTHPLVGGELRDERLRRLRDDVQSFNARAREARDDQFMSKADRDELRVDRQVLERRLAETPNADALGVELEGIDAHTVKAPTQEERAVQEFRSAAEQLARMASRGELLHDGRPNTAAQALVRKLENINYQRSGNRRIDGVEVRGRKSALPIPEALYDRLVGAGLVKTPEQVEAEAARSRADTDALRAAVEQQLDRIEAGKGKRALPRERGWREAARGVTPQAARQLTFSKYDVANLARRIAKTYVGNNRPTKGLTSYISARDRAHWADKTPLEKRQLRHEARIHAQRDIEEMIREMVEQRVAEARERVDQGLPPTREATKIEGEERTDRPTVAGRLPTAEQAIQQYREGMRAERQRRRGGEAVDRVRDRYYADRENIAKTIIKDAIKKRFIKPDRLTSLLDRLTATAARPPQRPSGVNFNLDKQTPANQRAIEAWEAATARWYLARTKQIADAKRLKSFLEYTIGRIRNDIERYKKRNGIVQREPANLAQPVWEENTQRYTFRSGANEERFDWYNYANDLQKMDENLRAMLVALGETRAPGQKTKPVPLAESTIRSEGQRRLRRGEFHAVAQPQLNTYFTELQRATRLALGEPMHDFAADMRLMLDDKMASIRIKRETRVEEVTQQRGVSRRAVGLPEEAAPEASTAELGGRPTMVGSERALLEDRTGSERTADTGEFTQRLVEGREQEEVAGSGAIERAGRWLKDPSTGVTLPSPVTPEDQRVISGGSKKAQEEGVNIIEQQTINQIAGEQRAAREGIRAKFEQEGRDFQRAEEIAMRQRYRNMTSTYPLRWEKGPATPEQLRIRAENLRKAGRRGMDPRAFDEEGLPVDRLGPHKEFEPYTAEEQRYLDAHAELNSPGEPTSPLVSPVETPQQTLDRVKDMVAKGQTGIVPEEYVTNEWLDRLAAVNEGTEVYHAPFDATSGLEGDSPGHYNTTLDRVVIPSDVSPDFYVRAALHENVHAATERSLLTDPAFRKEVTDLMQLGIKAAQRRGVDLDYLPRDLYGLSTPSEFIAELVSNKKFRQEMFRVPAPHNTVIQGIKNVLNAAYAAIQRMFRRLFGSAKDADTALDILFYDQSTVLGQADALVARTMKQLARDGRPDRAAALRALDSDDGRRYLSLSAGAQAFRDGLRERYDRAAFQLGQIRTENRAPGMAWRTMDQMTRIGSPVFRELTSDLHRIFEEMQGAGTQLRDADKRELAELATIWNNWNRDGRESAGQFMIDEGMHTAFADAPLGEMGPEYVDQETGERRRDRTGKNRHIDPALLRNAQVVHEHETMQRRLRELTNAPTAQENTQGREPFLERFAEFRDRVYKFTAAREEDIRRNNLRDQWAVSDFLPDGLDAKARDRMLDALRDWTDESATLTPADQRLLRDAGFFKNKKAIEHRDLVRSAKEFAHLEGPYSPFTRFGDWAVTGRFNIAKPANALTLAEDINKAATAERQKQAPAGTTVEPVLVDDARFVFPTEDDARDFVRQISDQYGIAQLDGGAVWIDTTTGQRPRVPDKRHAGKERIATETEIANHPNSEKIEQYHYVTFQPKLLQMHETQYDAQRAVNDLLGSERYKDKLDVSRPMDVFRHDARQNEHYTSTQMQNLINAVRASDAYQKLDANEQSAITRQMNLASEKFALRRGFKQRYLPRNYVKGASTKVLASLDDYSVTSSRYIAKVRKSSQLKEASDKIKDHLKGREYEQGDRNYVAQRRVYAAMMRRIHNPTRNPHETVVSRTLDRAMRITMLDKLPNVAYFTVNATETPALGIPLMAGRHKVGRTVATMSRMYRIAGTARRFANAAKNDLGQAWKRGTRMTNFLNLFDEAIDAAGTRMPFAAGTKDLMRQASARNLFDVNASLEYQSSFETNRKTTDVILDWGQGVFQSINTAIENLNRFVTLSTAYELEMRRLLNNEMTAEQRHKAASDYAMDMLQQVNGVYANYNAPEMFTREGPLGMLGPVVFQFKKWPQRITMIYLRTALGLIKGLGDWSEGHRMSPEHREAARQFVFMLAAAGLVAGAMGLPLEPFSHTLNLAYIMGLSSYNWDDVQAGFRVWMAKHGGADVAQLVAHGPLSFATGIDFAGRMSQSNMWAYGSPGSTKVRDLYGSLMQLVGGATLGTASEMVTGVQKGVEALSAFNNGADDVASKKFMEFLKGVIPVRLAADLIGSSVSAEGTELASGRKIGPDYSAFERMIRAGGFTPTRESEAREARNAIVSREKRETAARKGYVDLFTRSPPGAQREAVWRRIQSEWNPAHPGYEITRDDLLKADRTLRKARAEPREQLGIPQNRRNAALMPIAEAYGL